MKIDAYLIHLKYQHGYTPHKTTNVLMAVVYYV